MTTGDFPPNINLIAGQFIRVNASNTAFEAFTPSAVGHAHTTTDVTEGTNLYFTNTRVQSYLTAQSYRKVETFLGTTDVSGNVTITFANSYATAPDVQPQIVGGSFNQFVRVVSVSATQAVVQVAQRNSINLLGADVLLSTTVAVSGVSVTVQVTPRS